MSRLLEVIWSQRGIHLPDRVAKRVKRYFNADNNLVAPIGTVVHDAVGIDGFSNDALLCVLRLADRSQSASYSLLITCIREQLGHSQERAETLAEQIGAERAMMTISASLEARINDRRLPLFALEEEGSDQE